MENTPEMLDPAIENHPIIKACKVIMEVHQTQVDLIDAGRRFTRKSDDGYLVDNTKEVRALSVENIEKAKELIHRVRTEKVFSAPSVEIIRELDIQTSEDGEPFQQLPDYAPVPLSVSVSVTSTTTEGKDAEEVAEDPDTAIHLPEDRS